MTIKITFDSNVWRIVSDPETFAKDPEIEYCRKIYEYINKGDLLPCISETMFTYEVINKTDRKEFFANYKAKIEASPLSAKNSMTGMRFIIKPNTSYHPGNNIFFTKHLEKAIKLNFKILKCIRTGGIVNPEITEDMFLKQDDIEMCYRLDKAAEVSKIIEEELKCGFFHIKKIGVKYSLRFNDWKEGIKNAPDFENFNIAKAVAEWADGDSIAAHIAYKNDYFCTRDRAISAGSSSILSSNNIKILKQKYDLKIITIKELYNILEEKNDSFKA